MAQHNDLGNHGENLAVEYLMGHGYKILERNWFFQKAEIDIIARKENILAIVEVKTRSSTAFGLPQDFISPKKIQLLVKAVNEYVILNDLDVQVRFDIISVSKEYQGFNLEHLVEAFLHF